LAAAVGCFSRDGFRRTALDRVARAAGISRAAVYLHFANKEELFRALVEALHARTLEEADAAARGSGDLAERVTAMLVAKTGRFFDLLRASPHAEEFLDENHRLCGELSAAAAANHVRLLARLLASAADVGTIDPGRAGLSIKDAAELLLDTAEGIKSRGRALLSADGYRRRLGAAVRIVLAGLARPTPAAGRQRASTASAKRAIPAAISASESEPWPSKSAERRGRRRKSAVVE